MRKKLIWIVLLILLVSCKDISQDKNKINNSESNNQFESDVSSNDLSKENKILMSNMNGDKVLNEVCDVLNKSLDKDSVENFKKSVSDYNKSVQGEGLLNEFKNTKQPEYNISKLEELWSKEHGNFTGLNCRMNAFMLLKENIEVNKIDFDDNLLFMDIDSNKLGKVFNDEEMDKFKSLFSRVKTEAVKDVNIHGEKMQKFLSQFKFNDNARFISLAVHDNLDGDYLFIGHVGVLVKDKDGYLLVEKLSFQEPYQAVKFQSKEDCYKYFYNKYENYRDDSTSKPFIMDNENFIDPSVYNN
ncbi:DUF4300 family protein [Lagierella sp. ICN-221743]